MLSDGDTPVIADSTSNSSASIAWSDTEVLRDRLVSDSTTGSALQRKTGSFPLADDLSVRSMNISDRKQEQTEARNSY